MNRLGIAVVAALLVIPLVNSPDAPLRRWLAGPLPVLAEAPPFRLVADDGRELTSDSLRGRPWLASFLYTSCPGPCPRLVGRLKTVRARVPAPELAFVSFSVDPAHDTPPVLAEYKAKHGIAADADWTFVTGPSEEVLALVQRGFLTGVGAGEAGGDQGAVSHGTRVALVDGEQHIRGFYSTESDEDLDRLVRDAKSVD
jgi:protein SCO1